MGAGVVTLAVMGDPAPPTRHALLRAGLLVLTVLQVVVGGWALVFPRSFYDDFPAPGHPWVALLPPFNEHLVRDVGAFNLAFAFLFAAGAVTMGYAAIRAALIGYELYAVPHLVFHVSHLHGFPVFDAVAQTVSLVLIAALPLVLLGLTVGRHPRT